MKTASAKKTTLEHHLKVIKNSSKTKKTSVKLFINTLVPKFEYTNSSGELTSPINKVLF